MDPQKSKTHIVPYLCFNGNCREAMGFYQQCLGGELQVQTVGESPLAAQMPQQMKDCILHATLTRSRLVIMATDMTPASGRAMGNNVSLMLECATADELHRIYRQLSENGKADHPVEHTFWGALLGDLTDQYGNHWLLHFQNE
jgi:PhnB protein